MYAKIQITGTVEVVTGMHIGGSSAFSAIGAVDSTVMKDIRTNLPMIPGSSLKGKMRTLLSKEYNETLNEKPDDDCERLTRLFGCAKKGKEKRSRVLFSDMILNNAEDLRKQGLNSMTEVKFENTISRLTAVANPRQIERVVRGAQFGLDLIYDVEKPEDMKEDFETLAEGFRLLQYDYLGGHGSRGYGKVRFEGLEAKVVAGSVDEKLLAECTGYLKEVK